MCHWKSWLLPCFLATALLTTGAYIFSLNTVETDLTTRINNKLQNAEPWSSVQFDGRDATISGVHENDKQLNDVTKIVGDSYGVRIINDLSTLPQTAQPFVLSMIKNNDKVTVQGNYSNTENHLGLIDALKKSIPEIKIKDETTLASGQPDGFNALAEFGITQLSTLTKGEVSLSNMEYSIKGETLNVPIYDKLTAQMLELPNGAVLKNTQLIKPQDYTWSATRSNQTITLEGSTPDNKSATSNNDVAKRLFSTSLINDKQTVKNNNLGSMAEAQNAAVKTLSYLDEGKVSLKNTTLSLEGSLSSQDNYNVMIGDLSALLPKGYEISNSAKITPPLTIQQPDPVVQKVPSAIQQPVQTIAEIPSCLPELTAVMTTETINFESNQAKIKSSSNALIEKLANLFMKCDTEKIEVSGHTDTDGDSILNLTLSQERANSVMNALVSLGVPSDRLIAKGYGETMPIVNNDTIENKAKNRRIKFKLQP
jgi:OmpA-OmpF porin, OOP family